MIIVGELINASRRSVALAIEQENADAITELGADQAANGADYIDVNAGVFVDREAQYLEWLVKIVQQKTSVPCCIDSPNPSAIESALKVHQGTAMINSISLEKDRFEKILPLIAGTDLKIVCLCMSDDGMPKTAQDRFNIAEKLVNELVRNNVAMENIYLDPLIQPISTDKDFGLEVLNAVSMIMTTFSGCHTIFGLSNISYGLPARKLLNRTFMAMAIAKGLDSAIVNPLDMEMMKTIISAQALFGQDDYCMNYIKAYRAGKLA